MTHTYLADLSPKDKKWDESHKRQDSFADIVQQSSLNGNYKTRTLSCSGYLGFAVINGDLKLRHGNFCHVPLCPLCRYRRSLVAMVKVAQAAVQIKQDYPTYHFALLTLTVKNCPVEELRETLKLMSSAWTKMTRRKQWPAKGFMRRLEIGREKVRPQYCHPHYHCILLVNSSYFKSRYYLSQQAWTELWKSCLGVDYKPMVDIRRIYVPKGTKAIGTTAENAEMRALWKAVGYVTKYVSKESDLLWQMSPNQIMSSQENIEWFEELFNQLHNVKFTSAGGMFKKYINLNEQEMTDEELIYSGLESFEFERDDENDGSVAEDLDTYWFRWDRYFKRYLLHFINERTAQ